MPVEAAISRPKPIHRSGRMRIRSSAQQIVPAYEQENREGNDDGEHPLHDDGWYQQVVAYRVSLAPLGAFRVEGILYQLLLGQADTFVCRAETTQQRKDGQADNREH